MTEAVFEPYQKGAKRGTAHPEDLVGSLGIAEALGVSSRQVYAWRTRMTSEFPEPVACTLVPQYPGDKRKTPLWLLEEVLAWAAHYRRKDHRGAHWAAKRAQGPEGFEHGTEKGYQRHRVVGPWPIPAEDECGCRQAHAAYMRKR